MSAHDQKTSPRNASPLQTGPQEAGPEKAGPQQTSPMPAATPGDAAAVPAAPGNAAPQTQKPRARGAAAASAPAAAARAADKRTQAKKLDRKMQERLEAALQAPILPPASPAQLKDRHYGMAISFVLVVIVPLLISAFYLYGRAADQYASYVGFSDGSVAQIPSGIQIVNPGW